MSNIEEIVNCRLCRSYELNDIYHFGQVPLANSYPTTKNPPNIPYYQNYPLTLTRCMDCGHVQLKETINPHLLFDRYDYSSSDSPVLVEHFNKYAEDVLKEFPNHKKILELACNDSVLLKAFQQKDPTRLLFGVDPAENLMSKARQCKAKIYNDYFNNCLSETIKNNDGLMDIICANNVFAHISDINSVMYGINNLLIDGGIFIFENAWLLEMIKNNYFDQCLTKEHTIITERGPVQIDEINKEDRLLTHLGNFKKINHIFNREYSGELINIMVYGYNQPLRLTPEHPIYVSRKGIKQFVEAKNIQKEDYVLKSNINSEKSIENLSEHEKCKVWHDKEYQYSSIRSISKENYQGPLYNFEVEDDNSYTTMQGSVHNCYFEHMQYFGILPLKKYLQHHGFEIFKVKKVNTQGGSFRIYAKKSANGYIPIDSSVESILDEEYNFRLYDPLTYEGFIYQLNELKDKAAKLINPILKDGKTISCYGCPAKFTLLSKFFDLDDKKIQYVVDDSPLKIGKFSPGKLIPIVSNQHFVDNPTDYCIITAWNMAEPIMAKNKEYKGKWIIPLPEPKIIE